VELWGWGGCRARWACGCRRACGACSLRRKRPKVTKWLLRFFDHILNENLVPVLLAAMGCGPLWGQRRVADSTEGDETKKKFKNTKTTPNGGCCTYIASCMGSWQWQHTVTHHAGDSLSTARVITIYRCTPVIIPECPASDVTDWTSHCSLLRPRGHIS
jgi:hypothetical protein